MVSVCAVSCSVGVVCIASCISPCVVFVWLLLFRILFLFSLCLVCNWVISHSIFFSQALTAPRLRVFCKWLAPTFSQDFGALTLSQPGH